MSAAAVNHLDLTAPPVVAKLAQRMLIVGIVFAVISVATAFLLPNGAQEFYRAYLLSYMDWLGVALGSMAILMIRHLTGGGWGMVIRRILGAAMRTLPLLAILFIPIFFGMHHLYIWDRPLDQVADKHLREHLADITKTYLTPGGFIYRAIFYFAIWNVLSFLLSKWSKETDHRGSPDHTERFKAVAGPGLILYGFTISFAAIDWVMSIDPSWISTIFGLVILIGEVLSAMCFAVIVERILARLADLPSGTTSEAALDLAGQHIVVSAGGTREPLDPVRFITNRSSGKQGHAIAEAAARRGARVTLVTSSPLRTAPDVMARITRINVETAADMEQALRTMESSPLDHPAAFVDGASMLSRTGRDSPLAIRLLRRYVTSPNPVEEAPAFKAHYLLGELLEKQGDRPGAAEQYRTALVMAHTFRRAQEGLQRVAR